MPIVNDEFNRTCVRLDLDPERSGIYSPDTVMLQFSADDLRVFNECTAKVAPGTPALAADQIAGAARRLARAVGRGNESRFIQIRMRRAGEVRAMLADADWNVEPELLARAQDLLGYLDGPVALVPRDVPGVGELDRALLVDLAMDALRAELDDYADFCRFRASEAARLGLPVTSVNLDRAMWLQQRSEELRMERQVRRARSAAYGHPATAPSLFRVG